MSHVGDSRQGVREPGGKRVPGQAAKSEGQLTPNEECAKTRGMLWEEGRKRPISFVFGEITKVMF